VAERIVVMTPNWLGDAVMAFPALGAIRHHRPGATVIVAARPSTAPLFRMVSGVDEVVSLSNGGAGRIPGPLSGWAAEAAILAEARADIAILLPNSFRSALAARRARIPERWGYASDVRRFLLTRAVRRPGGRRHQSDYYNCLTTALGMPPGPETAARLVIPDEARARAAALLARRGVAEGTPVVGLAPGAAYGRAKQWPPGRFDELARLLHRRHGVVAVLVGVKADRDAARAMTPGPHLVDLVGETDLPALAGVMAHCRAFVSNDSGAMHLAAAAGLPVTAIFGSTDERGTAPLAGPSASAPPHEILTCDVWCRPCMLRECPIDHRCMTGIDPARVAAAVERQLMPRPESRQP
jgi:heptosyltransferase-2